MKRFRRRSPMLVVAFAGLAIGRLSADDSGPWLNTFLTDGLGGAALLKELSARSAIPEPELKTLLADCTASQLSMNVCAQRDQLLADHRLQQVIADSKARSPACAPAIEARAAAWRQRQQASCATSAARDAGGGTMEPMARLLCMTAHTTQYATTLSTQTVVCPAMR